MDAKKQKIIDTVDRLSDDILDFTQKLVREPSTLGNEAGAVEIMESELVQLNLEPVRVSMDSKILWNHPGFAPVPWPYVDKENVVAVKPAAGKGGRSALFNGHLDVVSPKPVDFWSFDPYCPFEKDGWLYGRGAGDMKSGVAAMTYALHAVEKAGFGLNGPATIEGVIEEECTGNGALACLVEGYDADAVLIPEPFGPKIYTHQVGVLWFKVDVTGTTGHVLSASAGTNAIEKCFPLIQALRKMEAEMNAQERPPAYQDFDHPINLNIGIFEGGDWPSTVPATAAFHCRLSYFPGTTFNTVRNRVRQVVKDAAAADPWLSENQPKVKFYGFRSDGHAVSRDLPALKTLNNCHKILLGTDAEEYISTCTTDLRAFHCFGQGEATCYGPVAENIHAANERVRIDSVIHTAKTYALFLAEWCGLAE